MKQVRLYSLSTCPSCNKVKLFLNEHGIKYENITVDLLDSGEQWAMTKELKKHNPDATYPTIVVAEVVLEFDEKKLKEALSINDA